MPFLIGGVILVLVLLLAIGAVIVEEEEKKKAHIKKIDKEILSTGRAYSGPTGIYKVIDDDHIQMKGYGTITWINGETYSFRHGETINLYGIKKRLILPSNYKID